MKAFVILLLLGHGLGSIVKRQSHEDIMSEVLTIIENEGESELNLRAAQLIEGGSGRHDDDGEDYANRRFFISTITRTVEDENRATFTKTESTYKTCYTTEPGVPGCRSRSARSMKISIDVAPRKMAENPASEDNLQPTKTQQLIQPFAEDEISDALQSDQDEAEERQLIVDSAEEFLIIDSAEEFPIIDSEVDSEVDSEQESAAKRFIDLESSIGGDGGDWIEREVIGIRTDFDPGNIAHRFLTVVDYMRETVTDTVTTYVPHSDVQQVIFGGCLPQGVDKFLEKC